MSILPLAAALVLSGALAFPAMAATVSYAATLKSSAEAPPNDSKGTGEMAASFDTVSNKLSWTVTYTGLSGPVTAAHFHGPAAVGANAGPVVPIPATGLASPIKGEVMLTEAQVKELADGKWYFNIHTAAHAPGEIRGQVMKK